MYNGLISVIIPAYNLEKYIEECIESIRKQTYQNIEIIIIDDGSSDNTLSICEKIQKEDHRLIVISQKNAGVTAARAKGVEVARGQYVTFVDGDDLVVAEMLEKMSQYIHTYELVIGGFIRQASSGETKKIHSDLIGAYMDPKCMEEVYNNILYNSKKQRLSAIGYGSLCGKLFRREIIARILDQMDNKITFAEDVTCLILYVLECKSIMFLDECYYFYRYRETSAMHSINTNMLENINRIYNLLKPEFDKHIMSAALNEQLERWIFFWVINAMNSYMGFSKERRLPQFLIGLDEFLDKKIIVYGAGEMGQDIIWQYEKMGQKAVAWIDRDHVSCQKKGLQVKSIECLNDERLIGKIDAVLIAVSSDETANEIRKDLIKMDIPEDLIIWKKPMCIY